MPELGIRNARARYADVRLYDSGSVAALPYDTGTPIVRVRAGTRIHLRPVDRDITMQSAYASFYPMPPARELRDGWIHTIGESIGDADPVIRDDRVLGIRAPVAPGRYLLEVSGQSRDSCIVSLDAVVFVVVDVR